MTKHNTGVERSAATARDGTAIIYEQPLSERIRTLLRLEYLFAVIATNSNDDSPWASRAAIAAMIDVTDLLARADLKGELLKELDRQAAVLSALKRNPKVDLGRLEDALARLEEITARLRAPDYQPGQTLRRDELVASIRQRISIPGGTCNFDLPGFHYWLTQPAARRIERLQEWFGDLQALCDAVDLALAIIRASAAPKVSTARGGFFQQPLDASVTCQLVRVGLPTTARCYPEISAGKHRFTVRFLVQDDTGVRPTQSGEDVTFVLEVCVI